MDIVLLIGSLAIILIAAELFTNGIEWFGHRLNLAEGAVGSVLAAVATAMPETLIPVIAILGPVLFGGDPENSHDIGTGAILGAPFMLSTLAMFVTGVAIVTFSRSKGRRDGPARQRPGPGPRCHLLPGGLRHRDRDRLPSGRAAWVRWLAAAVLVLIYAIYVRLHFTDPPEESEADDLNQLHLTRLPGMAGPHTLDIDVLPGESDGWEIDGAVPRMRIIVTQVVLALALIIIGAQVFVGAVEHLSSVIGLDPTILALDHRPHRHRAAGEVQQRHLGADRQGHAGDGQHHRRDGLPELPAHGAGHPLHRVDLQGESALSFLSAGVAFVSVPDLRPDAAAGAPLGMDVADRWSDLPDLRLLALFTPLGVVGNGHCPRIPQPSRRASRRGRGRAYTLPAGATGSEPGALAL